MPKRQREVSVDNLEQAFKRVALTDFEDIFSNISIETNKKKPLKYNKLQEDDVSSTNSDRKSDCLIKSNSTSNIEYIHQQYIKEFDIDSDCTNLRVDESGNILYRIFTDDYTQYGTLHNDDHNLYDYYRRFGTHNDSLDGPNSLEESSVEDIGQYSDIMSYYYSVDERMERLNFLYHEYNKLFQINGPTTTVNL